MNRQRLGVVFVVAVALALGARYYLSPDAYRTARADREVAARALAAAVVARQPGQRALVFSNPYVAKPGIAPAIVEMEQAGLRGLRAVEDGRFITAVVAPDLRPAARENPRAIPIDHETTTPLSYLVAPDAFDRAAQAHPECDVVISLIGLPSELDQCELWKKSGPPSFALLLPDLRVIGDVAAVVAAIKSDKILAIVLRKPGGVAEGEPLGGNFKAEFERRFLLITRENIDEIAARSPTVLQSP